MRRIVDVIPVPHYAKVPARAFESLRLGRIGKGELVTLVQLALYVPGEHPEPVGGTTAEWVATLDIGERTWQLHIPKLGLSGDLRCLRPYAGYWVLFGLNFSGEESDHPPEEAGNPKKISAPVVVDLSSPENDSDLTADDHSVDLEQQQSLPAHGPNNFSACDQAAFDGLRSLGVTVEAAVDLLAGWDSDWISDVARVVRRRGAAIENPAGFAIRAIRGDWALPELQAKWFGREPRTGADYLTDGVQW